jgi:hypothetical protein
MGTYYATMERSSDWKLISLSKCLKKLLKIEKKINI